MSDVTRILSQIESGDSSAAEKLLPLVYEELRKLAAARLAQEKPGHTLQATALVHEAYLRLVGGGQQGQSWDNRGHFFAAAAEAMRRILVESARRKQALRHGGEFAKSAEEPDAIPVVSSHDPGELLAIHEALDDLAAKSPRKAELVKLRYFLSCTIAEAAAVLGIAVATAEEDWTYSKAWLKQRLRSDN